MKKTTLHIILLFLVFIISCKKETSEKIELKPLKKEIVIDTLKDSIIEVHNDFKKTSICDCDIKKYRRSYSTDLNFQNSNHSKSKNDSIFLKWSNDSLLNKITSIRFSGFDTIPKKYSIFKNVERLTIKNRNGIYGLDAFPKLKTIFFLGSSMNLNTNEKWLAKIEAIYAEKTKFIGPDSFSKMPNLNILSCSFSGFEEFPKDLEQLDCINELRFGAYMFGNIDLNLLDFSKNKCLKNVLFQSWRNTLTGIPKGLPNSNIKELEIRHQKLTKPEKEQLEIIKANL